MKIKLLSAVAVLATGFAAAPAFADETPEFTITGSAAIVSQYRFRGLSQSNNKPAVQASATLSHKSGFYVATWGSSTYGDSSFTESPISPGGTEIDVYGGYTKGFMGVTFDGGLYGYIYPSAPINNYFEVYGSLAKSLGPVTAKVGLNWAPKQTYFDDLGSPTKYNMYEYAELSYTYGPATLHGHIGHTGGGLNYTAGAGLPGKEYMDFTVGASYKWKSLTFDVSAVGTNIGRGTLSDYADKYIGVGSALPGSAINTYFYRPAKTVVVASLTASF